MKKFVFMILILSMLILCIPVRAAENDAFQKEWDAKPVAELTTEELERAVAAFLYGSPDEHVSVASARPVYDTGLNQIGWIANYSKYSEEYGFVLFDFTKENPVAEYTIGFWHQTDPVFASVKSARTAGFYESGAPYIYVNPFVNGVLGSDGNLYGTCSEAVPSELLPDVQPRFTVYASWDELFNVNNDLVESCGEDIIYTGIYDSYDSHISQNQILEGTDDINPDAPRGYYCCAAVALTEIAAQYDILLNDDLVNTFLEFWDLGNVTGVLKNYEDTGEKYMAGSMHDNSLRTAFTNYCSEMDRTGITDRMSPPDFDYFKTAVDNDLGAILAARIYVENNQGFPGYMKAGHSINVVGYYEHENADGTVTNYLAVADGWTDNVRLFDYENIDFTTSLPYGVRYHVQELE